MEAGRLLEETDLQSTLTWVTLFNTYCVSAWPVQCQQLSLLAVGFLSYTDQERGPEMNLTISAALTTSYNFFNSLFLVFSKLSITVLMSPLLDASLRS